jgi:hypothetical protein
MQTEERAFEACGAPCVKALGRRKHGVSMWLERGPFWGTSWCWGDGVRIDPAGVRVCVNIFNPCL